MSIRFLIYSINSLLIIWFIFYQNKDYRSSLKWIFLFLLFPIISFLFYYFLGMGIKVDKKKYQKIFDRTEQWIPKGVENDNEVAAYLKNAGGFEAYQNTKNKLDTWYQKFKESSD